MANNPNTQTVANPRRKKVLMWQLTSSQADLWFAISNGFLIVGAVAVLLGTIGSIATGIVRDHFSEVRISENEKETQVAKVEAAQATLKVAEANKQIAELNVVSGELKAANLQLEAQVAPRRITKINISLLGALKKLTPKTIRIASYSLDPDGAVLATQLLEILSQQGFQIQDARMTEGPSTSLVFGAWVSGGNAPLVKALVEYLNDAGIQAIDRALPPASSRIRFNNPTFSSEADALIFVGVKPLPR